ncbi:phytoene/squalene synthase family protein [Kovacikia minuta CCNUW1]|uniref:squalene/phytoene synthase family protein n=1 Tax=Kovacikia minuta TaxID=2931930 RepID=UPI001CCAB584|nr:phytoene/squalene synthase family protein [Kovacikia minuta]UBF24278.1 phytoene/squalene synthase family protein [Kovacikia minuta CCNUW1]
MELHKSALEVLKETSRTFYIPISRLPSGLQEAVSSAYLCMRAIDEVEDHPDLNNALKVKLLQTISLSFQAASDRVDVDGLAAELSLHTTLLPEVTIRIGEWAMLAPGTIAARVWDSTAAMADRMAYWSGNNWRIQTQADLDRYTFSVAGTVGLLLSDLWAWYDGTQTNRAYAVGFGRGLQAVNIMRNHSEDLARGVDFFPDGWDYAQMETYARRNLAFADAYTSALPLGPALDFCKIPLALAHATIDAMAQGEAKLSRTKVLALVEQFTAGSNR